MMGLFAFLLGLWAARGTNGGGGGGGPGVPGGLPGGLPWPFPTGGGIPGTLPGGGGAPGGGGGAPGGGAPGGGGGGGAPPPASAKHTIVWGDTGSGLAKRYTGNAGRWKEILAANPGMTTYTDSGGATQIKPWQIGQVINLPPGWAKAP